MKILFFLLLFPSCVLAEDLTGNWFGTLQRKTDTCNLSITPSARFLFKVKDRKSIVTLKLGTERYRGIKVGKRGLWVGKNQTNDFGCIQSTAIRLDKIKNKNKAKVNYRFVGECGFFPGPDCEFEAIGTAKRE